MPKFQQKTLNVIAHLKKVLKTKKYFPTKGHFYREIEILKFPWMTESDHAWYRYGNNGRNVYSQQQYDTIVRYCIEKKWITIQPKNNHAYHVIVSNEIA
jgi:hypothetical protein